MAGYVPFVRSRSRSRLACDMSPIALGGSWLAWLASGWLMSRFGSCPCSHVPYRPGRERAAMSRFGSWLASWAAGYVPYRPGRACPHKPGAWLASPALSSWEAWARGLHLKRSITRYNRFLMGDVQSMPYARVSHEPPTRRAAIGLVACQGGSAKHAGAGAQCEQVIEPGRASFQGSEKTRAFFDDLHCFARLFSMRWE